MATTTPRTSMKSKLFYADTLTGERTQIAYVQEIPALKGAKNSITYSSLEDEEEHSAPGIRPAEDLTIPVLYTEEQHDKVKALETAGKDLYWFVQLPEETATQTGKPLTWYFTATVSLSNDTLSVDEMIQENITLYKSSDVLESKGFPTA